MPAVRTGHSLPSYCRLNGAGGKVEPLVLAVRDSGQSAPMQDARFIAADFEHDCGGGAVQEMYPPLPSLAPQTESPNAAARQTCQIIFPALKGEEDQIDQSLCAALQVPTEAEQTLAVTTERIKADCDRTSVRPQDLIAFVVDCFAVTIFVGVPAKEDHQGS